MHSFLSHADNCHLGLPVTNGAPTTLVDLQLMFSPSSHILGSFVHDYLRVATSRDYPSGLLLESGISP